jgi:limonene-1,2-epoxide hydrolase
MSNLTSEQSEEERNKAVAGAFWARLAERDFDAMAEFIAPDGHYIDVPLVGTGDGNLGAGLPGDGLHGEPVATSEPGAVGPEEVIARLRLGIEPLEKYVLHDGRMIAEGNTVVTEHSEEWFWHTGEHHLVRFCSIQEFSDGKIQRWWDYVDLSQLLNAAPQWWIDHILEGYK